MRLRERGRQREQWLYLVVLLEFQSQVDADMALRFHTYTGLLYEELRRNEKVLPGERLPYALPVVVYNGKSKWSAPRTMRALIADSPSAPALEPFQPAEHYEAVDVRNLVKDTLPSDGPMSLIARIEQSASVADYEYARVRINRPEVGDGLWRALTELQRQALKREAPEGVKLPPIGSRREEEKMSLAEGMSEWSKPWIQQGIAQGIAQGVAQGLARERALLSRQAELRFDAETAARVAGALEQTTDPERLAEAGEAIVQCASSDELVERVLRIAEA